MRTTIARVLGTLRAMVVPVVKAPGSPVWHLSWPWGMLQCWRRGDSKWGVGIGRNVGLHIHAGRMEAWTKRRRRRHNMALCVAPGANDRLHGQEGSEE